ncbi:MAG: hypothetical protein JXD19_07135 [Deltaproteobacteria bacterium]|nr:hypothetical protein [Deltaproteobacteria bacterium]
MQRAVASLHIAHFCLALTARNDVSLTGKLVALAELGRRGTVIDISPEAREEGIHPGMPTEKAKKLCRSLILVPPDFPQCRRGHAAVISKLYEFTPLVESAGWETWFLDLTGTRRLWGVGVDAAVRVRDAIALATGFHPQIGLAVNKLVSGVAAKLSYPLDVCSVVPGEERGFLAPLPIRCLPRLGKATREVLQNELGVHTIGCLAQIPPYLLAGIFGKEGTLISRLARGEDDEAVVPLPEAASLGFSSSLPGGENRRQRLHAHLFGICEDLGRELRKRNRVPGSLSIEIMYADGLKVKSSVSAGDSNDDLDSNLFRKSSLLFDRVVKRRVRITRITLVAGALRLPFSQLPLFSWDGSRLRARALMTAIDRVRERFGSHALLVGRTLVR